MLEKTKQFLVENKGEIKTGAILVLAPIAIIGMIALKGYNDIAHFLSNASDSVK